MWIGVDNTQQRQRKRKATAATSTSSSSKRSKTEPAKAASPLLWSYIENVYPTAKECTRLHTELKKMIDAYEAEHGRAHGRMRNWSGPLPRRQAMFSTTAREPYLYLNTYFLAQDMNKVDLFTKELLPKALELIRQDNPSAPVQDFNYAVVNEYEDGKHYVTDHPDGDSKEGYIVSFTFHAPGGARLFRVRENATEKIVWSKTLGNGSVVLMRPGMQAAYTHGLKVKGSRINVTFRLHSPAYIDAVQKKYETSKEKKKKDGEEVPAATAKTFDVVPKMDASKIAAELKKGQETSGEDYLPHEPMLPVLDEWLAVIGKTRDYLHDGEIRASQFEGYVRQIYPTLAQFIEEHDGMLYHGVHQMLINS